MLSYFVGFFLFLEFTPNFYAELSGFADRQFYLDFWNATNFDEYSRKWNRLVHEFLQRHFYLEYLLRHKFTVFQAVLMTFSFSVLFHEIFFTVVFRRVSLYLSCLQINQLLLLFIFSKLKGTMLGNMIYWFGVIFGATSVAYNYNRDYFNYKYSRGGKFDI
jgi:sterol O-acyltransferase